MFKFNKEKIYKFVYESGSGYHSERKTILLTAYNPVQAVKMFNRRTKDGLYNIVEFVEVTPKAEKD